MATQIEFDFNWYYNPDEMIPPGNCVNSFDNIAEQCQYIDENIHDAYNELNLYEKSFVGPQGQISSK